MPTKADHIDTLRERIGEESGEEIAEADAQRLLEFSDELIRSCVVIFRDCRGIGRYHVAVVLSVSRRWYRSTHDRIRLRRSQYSDYRHCKRLRHCTRMVEHSRDGRGPANRFGVRGGADDAPFRSQETEPEV